MRHYKFLVILVTVFMPFFAWAQVNSTNELNMKNDNFLYFEVATGYDFYHFNDFTTNSLVGVNNASGGSSGNVTLNSTLGYQLTKHFSSEIGFIFTPGFNYNYTLTTINDSKTYQMGVKPWTIYFAGKFLFPLAPKLSGFVKLGVAYHHAKFDDSSAYESFNNRLGTNNDSMFSPLLGIGASYDITSNVYVFGEGFAYLVNNDFSDNGFLPTSFDLDHNGTVLFGVGYKFK